jgi:hypothetical protein
MSKKSIDKFILVCCLFMDLSKAFDMIDHGMFVHEIELMNVSGAERDFLLSFLNDRTEFVCVGDTVSTTSRIDIGLPQGSPASPKMFNIFVNRTFQCNFKRRLQMYADDVALLIKAANLSELMSKLQSDVATMNEFFTSIGLRFNVKKTNFIVFNQMGKLNDSFLQENRPMPNETAIERVANQVYLGLQFDEGLIWSEHIDAVLKKLRPMVFAIKRSRDILDVKQLWSLYHAYIVSHVCYLNLVWNCASRENATRETALLVLMNQTIKAIKRLRCDHLTVDLYGGEILAFDRLSIFQDMLLTTSPRHKKSKQV